MSTILDILAIAVLAVIAGAIAHRFPDREDEGPDNSWVHKDLDSVPYVITQPEPKGHLLPWYRRVLARTPKPEPEPPPLTYRS